jgi:hypothetical protein
VCYLDSETPSFASFIYCDSATRHLGLYLTLLGNHNRDIFLSKESICQSCLGTGHWSTFKSWLSIWLDNCLAGTPHPVSQGRNGHASSSWTSVIGLHANPGFRSAS